MFLVWLQVSYVILLNTFLSYFYSYLDNLKELGVKCLFIADNDGSGTMEVYGNPSAVRFAETSQLAERFFVFVNEEGIRVIQIFCIPC